MADDTDFDGLALDFLRRRRSEKWLTFPPDVLPSFVAELDVPLAEPVRRRWRPRSTAATSATRIRPGCRRRSPATPAGRTGGTSTRRTCTSSRR